MSEAKFTKGKWKCVTHDGSVKCAVVYMSGGGFDISNCPDSVANAHLIAAAPEMYEMLDKLSPMFTEINAHALSSEVDALLAKARGES